MRLVISLYIFFLYAVTLVFAAEERDLFKVYLENGMLLDMLFCDRSISKNMLF